MHTSTVASRQARAGGRAGVVPQSEADANGQPHVSTLGDDPQLGSLTADWEAWQRHLASRENPESLTQLFPGRRSALLWGVPTDSTADEPSAPCMAAAIARVDRLARPLGVKRAADAPLVEAIAVWVASLGDKVRDTALGLESLAFAHALPGLARLLPEATWRSLWQALLDMASAGMPAGDSCDPWAQQLWTAELPVTLAHFFPELPACRELAPAASQAIAAQMSRVLDAEGVPHSRFLSQARPLLACWTRCLALGGRGEHGGWNDETQLLYLWMVRQSLRLSRRSGAPVFSGVGDAKARAADASLLQAAIGMVSRGDRDRVLYESMYRGARRAARPARKQAGTPACAIHSEAAGVAVLRSNWSPAAPKLAIDYGGAAVRCELSSGDTVLLSGEWSLQVTRDGEVLPAADKWENVCWISDEDVDYLEIEAELAPGLRVQRQALLARKDEFLLLADILLADAPRQFVTRAAWRLTSAARPRLARESREGVLAAPACQALLLPLALPEWRQERRAGELTATESSLELTHRTTEARALYAPLFFDLRTRRNRKPATWRQLTVAENRAILPVDAAAAFRAQVGQEQWLFYRALDGRGNRTVLGHNLVSEFLAARFDRTGQATAIVEIE